MITMNKWESQFMYLAKNHFNDENRGVPSMPTEKEIMVARHIWADRCGIDVEHVHIKDINAYLIKLTHKVGMFDKPENISKFLVDLAPNSKYKPDIPILTDNREFAVKIFVSCMAYLCCTKILEGDRNNGFVELIHLEPKENKYIFQEEWVK